MVYPFCQKNIIYCGKTQRKVKLFFQKGDSVQENELAMSENSFVVDHKEGRKGELYVQRHLDELMGSCVYQ